MNPSKVRSKPSNPPLFIIFFEGDTEKEFYWLLFKSKLQRGTKILPINLKGKVNNKAIASKLDDFLWRNTVDCSLHVIIAYDRDHPLETEPSINIKLLRKDFIETPSGITSIDEIVAIQDVESWFFLDIDGIYKYLKTEKSKRAPHRYKAHQSFNNRDLSQLFYLHKKKYRKGEKVSGFIEQLDLEKIYLNCSELKAGIDLIISKCK